MKNLVAIKKGNLVLGIVESVENHRTILNDVKTTSKVYFDIVGNNAQSFDIDDFVAYHNRNSNNQIVASSYDIVNL